MSLSRPSPRNTDRFVLFFDYDGTLTDFKKDPNRSLLPASTRKLLQQLRRKHTIVIVTGRNLDRLYEVSGLKGFPAVGTHGFECRHLPAGLRFASAAQQKKYRRESLALWKAVQDMASSVAGVHIEKKPFSSTLHYRGANLSPQAQEDLVHEYVRRCRKVMTPGLWTLQRGKKMEGWAIAVGNRISKKYWDIQFKTPSHLAAWLKRSF
jgi:trehalose-phosphatase